MIIFDDLGREAEYGRVKIERNYDDFSQSIPNWLELDNCTLSENLGTNAMLTRVNNSVTMKLKTKAFRCDNLAGMRVLLGNMTSGGIEKIEVVSEDELSKLSIKKETNGRAGMYVNDAFVKLTDKKVSFGLRTDVPDIIGSGYFDKAQTIGIHFLPQNKSFNLWAYGGDMGECILPETTEFNINKNFRFVFEWNLDTVTFSQAKLILWKSY